jgi:hypothetical protein
LRLGDRRLRPWVLITAGSAPAVALHSLDGPALRFFLALVGLPRLLGLRARQRIWRAGPSTRPPPGAPCAHPGGLRLEALRTGVHPHAGGSQAATGRLRQPPCPSPTGRSPAFGRLRPGCLVGAGRRWASAIGEGHGGYRWRPGGMWLPRSPSGRSRSQTGERPSGESPLEAAEGGRSLPIALKELGEPIVRRASSRSPPGCAVTRPPIFSSCHAHQLRHDLRPQPVADWQAAQREVSIWRLPKAAGRCLTPPSVWVTPRSENLKPQSARVRSYPPTLFLKLSCSPALP